MGSNPTPRASTLSVRVGRQPGLAICGRQTVLTFHGLHPVLDRLERHPGLYMGELAMLGRHPLLAGSSPSSGDDLHSSQVVAPAAQLPRIGGSAVPVVGDYGDGTWASSRSDTCTGPRTASKDVFSCFRRRSRAGAERRGGSARRRRCPAHRCLEAAVPPNGGGAQRRRCLKAAMPNDGDAQGGNSQRRRCPYARSGGDKGGAAKVAVPHARSGDAKGGGARGDGAVGIALTQCPGAAMPGSRCAGGDAQPEVAVTGVAVPRVAVPGGRGAAAEG